MERVLLHHGSVLLALLVACSLIAAPITMADWGEQAVFSVERVDSADLDAELPVLRYESLSRGAQDAIDSAIDAPDGRHTVYGQADWPDDFFYTYNGRPGKGIYAINDGGQYYRLVTDVSGGLPPIYWVLEIPFILSGLVLASVAVRAFQDGNGLGLTAGLAFLGLTFHLLGPAVDFPLLDPMAFVAYGAAVTALVQVPLAGRLFVPDSQRAGD